MLTDAEINALWGEWKDALCLDHKTWARAIEAEVRKQDEALIRQMLEALTRPVNSFDTLELKIKALAAARARLGEGGAA